MVNKVCGLSRTLKLAYLSTSCISWLLLTIANFEILKTSFRIVGEKNLLRRWSFLKLNGKSLWNITTDGLPLFTVEKKLLMDWRFACPFFDKNYATWTILISTTLLKLRWGTLQNMKEPTKTDMLLTILKSNTCLPTQLNSTQLDKF
jgi:hypothetical protein